MTANNSTLNEKTLQNYVCLGLQYVDFKMSPNVSYVGYFSATCCIGLAILILIGNFFILYVVYQCTELQRSKNLLFCAMAVTDFLVGAVVLPLNIIVRINEATNTHVCWMKSAQSFTSYFLCGCSVTTVAFVSIDRYVAAAQPFKYRSPGWPRQICRVLAGIWMMWIVLLILPYARVTNLTTLNGFSGGMILLWLLTVVCCYCKVTRILKSNTAQRPQNVTENTSHKRRASTIFAITTVFLICYAPWLISSIILAIYNVGFEAKYIVGRASELFLYLNSALNPFVYCYRSPKLKSAVLESVKHFFRAKSRVQPID